MHQQETIKIHLLHCGFAWVDEALAYKTSSWNPIAFTGILRSKKHQIRLPLTCFLIEHPKGLILVDTGWNPLIRTLPIKAVGFLQTCISKAELPNSKAIVEQLQQLNYKPSDIDYLVLTHLHGDHISGLHSVADANKIIVSDIELKTAKANPIVYDAKMWKGTKLTTFSFNASNLGPEHLSFDLLGDGSIQLLSTPGHTSGLTSIYIQNNNQFVILCADIAYSKRSWENMLLPGLTTNAQKAKQSLEWLAKQSKLANCKGIFASHDIDNAEQIIEL